MVNNIWGNNALVGGTGGSGGNWTVTSPQFVGGHVNNFGTVVEPYQRQQQQHLVGGGIDQSLVPAFGSLNQQPTYSGGGGPADFFPNALNNSIPPTKAPPPPKKKTYTAKGSGWSGGEFYSKEEANAALKKWNDSQPSIYFEAYPKLGKFHTEEDAQAALAKFRSDEKTKRKAEAEKHRAKLIKEREAREAENARKQVEAAEKIAREEQEAIEGQVQDRNPGLDQSMASLWVEPVDTSVGLDVPPIQSAPNIPGAPSQMPQPQHRISNTNIGLDKSPAQPQAPQLMGAPPLPASFSDPSVPRSLSPSQNNKEAGYRGKGNALAIGHQVDFLNPRTNPAPRGIELAPGEDYSLANKLKHWWSGG